ncbi:hypothetical protein DPMN_143189 [Dreissena polymorpha]|uniref:Mab-21-like HhH/H2TH-like domain-containing protein n=1 Tax=Dreissena polymorpha TaxID=45954 RepID=A0A9D4JMY5_DREPO|nr:hypothetical protein DPMN_143189 [Dreissena polymorpha]
MADIGVNEEMVSLRRHVSLAIDRYVDICGNVSRPDMYYKQFTFGSQSEGSTSIGMMSDTDVLVCFGFRVARVHLSDCQESTSDNFLVINEPTSLPQCCSLQVVGRVADNIYLPMRVYATTRIPKNLICDEKGRLLYNSTFDLNMYLRESNFMRICCGQQHGPAITTGSVDPLFAIPCQVSSYKFHGQQYGLAIPTGYFDTVNAIQCPTLPDKCRAFFTRARPGHWPKNGTLSKAEQCEVYMVNPGLQGHTFGYDNECRSSFIKLQYQTKFVESQFRISTNMTERLLMFDLNIVQMKAFVITKMIRKEILVDAPLSTFHMKTALLFTIEQFPEDVWRNDNLVQCVIYCLKTLKRFLKRCYCPYYTISSVNLFEGKLTKNEINNVKRNVTKMIEDISRCLLGLCTDDVGWRLSASSVGLQVDSTLSTPYTGKLIRCKIITEKLQKMKLCYQYTHRCLRTPNDLKMAALAIKSASATDQEYMHELKFMYQSMCSYLASWLASDCIGNCREVTPDVICMYESTLRSKDISKPLKYASMLVCTRQLDRACTLLDRIENMITAHLITVLELFEQNIDAEPKSDEKSNKCTWTEVLMEYATFGPIFFLKSEINCVPGHLIYEKCIAITTDELQYLDTKTRSGYINEVFESDVKVFFYYLQYLASNNIDKKRLALENLRSHCDGKLHCGNTWHVHLSTSLNMLGHVYELENNLRDAWAVYRISFAIQPRNNTANAHLFRLFGHVAYS